MYDDFKKTIDGIMMKMIPQASHEWVRSLHEAMWEAGLRLKPTLHENYATMEDFRRVCRERDVAEMKLEAVVAARNCAEKWRDQCLEQSGPYVTRAEHEAILKDRDIYMKLADEREKALKLAEEAERKALAAYHKEVAAYNQLSAARWPHSESGEVKKLTECNNRLSAELLKQEQENQKLTERNNSLSEELFRVKDQRNQFEKANIDLTKRNNRAMVGLLKANIDLTKCNNSLGEELVKQEQENQKLRDAQQGTGGNLT